MGLETESPKAAAPSSPHSSDRTPDYESGRFEKKSRYHHWYYRREPDATVSMPPEPKPKFAPRREKDGGPPPKRSIQETAYDFLYAKGAEADGYGLYSYLIFPRADDRGVEFLSQIVSVFPSVSGLPTPKDRINILYIPTKTSSSGQPPFGAPVSKDAIHNFLFSDYDLSIAHLLLNHLCDKPAPDVTTVCASALAGGPYLLTYTKKISDLSPLPPPYLFVDLTNVRPRAFSRFIAAYASQVKSATYSDRAKIDDFRLTLLNITLTAADWVLPINKAVAEIVHHSDAKEAPGAGKSKQE